MTAKSDNRIRFREFFTKEYSKLVNYIYKYIDTRMYSIDPEDIIQDVALNIFEKVDFGNPIDNIAAYLYRAVRNKIIDIQRKPKREVKVESVYENEEDHFYTSLLDEIEINDNITNSLDLQQELSRAIEQLKPDQQAIIIETEFEGATFEELSERWSVPIGTLLSRKSRAIQKLKQLLINK